jgi:tRNA-specific 2-thiouridylase
MSKKGRVLVAMSGGVDSSIAALLLKEQGYEVIGMTMKTWDYESSCVTPKETGCCSIDSINDARALAVKLGFPHYVIDFKKEFEEKIISNFIEEYTAGRTPNPCVLCNKLIKWNDLLEKADNLDCEFIATGHYAKVIHENGRFFLRKGIDDTKDQTYVLYGLTQENLSRTIFPLGDLKKTDIKEMAVDAGFDFLAKKSESYEICFIPDNDYRKFLKNRIPDLEKNYAGGDFLDKDGKVLGKHNGYPFYTIGQRKGLVIAVGTPLYVNKIDPKKNTVTLGNREDLMSDELTVSDYNLMKYEHIDSLKNITTKIRYKDKGAFSSLYEENSKIFIKFVEKVSAVTSGQSAVFYEGDDLIGGGIID